jgi:hypothetical protein
MIVNAVGDIHFRGALETNSVRFDELKVRVVPRGNRIFGDGGCQFLWIPNSAGNDRIGKDRAVSAGTSVQV